LSVVAVRHAEDHVHLVAVLARDDGRAVRIWRDYPKLRAACRAVEEQYGLHVTSAADGTVPPRPTRAEMEKTVRRAAARSHGPQRGTGVLDPSGRPAQRTAAASGGRRPLTARERLRVAVRRAAVASADAQEFLDRLRDGTVLVKERRGEHGELTGYAVALPDDLAAGGVPVFYGGGKLAADLTLPRLQTRWADKVPDHALSVAAPAAAESPKPREVRNDAGTRAQVLRAAAEAADQAAAQLRDVAGADAGAEIGHATVDALAAVGQVIRGTAARHVATAADAFERAAQAPGQRRGLRARGQAAAHLSRAAWALTHAGAESSVCDRKSLVAFVFSMAALADAIAAWHRQARREQQADAAGLAASLLREATASLWGESFEDIAGRTPREPAAHVVKRRWLASDAEVALPFLGSRAAAASFRRL
jgi:hypothetical protein